MITPLNADAILGFLNTAVPGIDVAVVDGVDSTNDWSRRDYAKGCQPPLLRVAESQLAGKGRRGRTWVSNAGGDIIMSVVRRLDLPTAQLGCLSVAMGQAVASCLRDHGVEGVRLKWPNDVLVDGGKICGLLIESLHDPESSSTVIIGIGMNIQPVSAEVSPYPVTSLSEHIDTPVDRNKLTAALVIALDRGCRRMQRDPVAMHRELDSLLDTGEIVDLRYEDGSTITGIMRGMNETGELQVLVDGELKLCNSADISIRQAQQI